MQHRHYQHSLLALAAGAACCASATMPMAWAQEGAERPVIEEVVVTARKREEALLDVPLTMTALTADAIEAKGIVEFKDVIDFTPGFFFAEHSVGRGDRSNRLLVVRGMRINTENDHQQAATVFVDGVPMLGNVISGLEDAQRIEVVRGPQSAYFGRSTFAGAVNFVTKTPGNELRGKVNAEAGKFGTSNFGLQLEGPLVADKLFYRISGSQWQTDGHWQLSNDPTLKLGSRKTFSVAGTLYATPTENFSAKLRLHAWRDNDGPSAAFGYGIGNGENNYNCNPSGSVLPPLNGRNNWICGEAPFPEAGNIQGDFVLTPEKAQLLAGKADPGRILDAAFVPPFLEGFGLERRAKQGSLILDYEFANGVGVSSSTAYHSNEWMALDDLDRRFTAPLGALRDVTLLNSRDLEDFSQEIRINSSSEQRLRWLLGASIFDFEGVRTSGLKVLGSIRSFSFGNIFDIRTTGLYGSIEYDLSDQFTLTAEARQQWDDLTEARSTGAEEASGTFKSFTPRFILNYKPSDDLLLYASYAEGTRPGAFNVGLLGQPQSVLEQLASIGLGLEVPEEKLQNLEFGVKGALWDGRAQIQAAIYKADWDAQSSAGLAVTLPDGATDFIAGSVVGGNIDLWGLEFEGVLAVTENLSLEATFSLNDSEIKVNNNCADCGLLIGTSDISGLGKRLSRNPRTQGSLSGAYQGSLNESYDWFGRVDYIFTGSRYATPANLTKTGASHRVNLRAGLERGNLRLELYGENVFNDKTFTNYQVLLDFAYFTNRVLTAGLPDKAAWGVRAAYSF